MRNFKLILEQLGKISIIGKKKNATLNIVEC